MAGRTCVSQILCSDFGFRMPNSTTVPTAWQHCDAMAGATRSKMIGYNEEIHHEILYASSNEKVGRGILLSMLAIFSYVI